MSVFLMSSSWELEIALNGVSAKIGLSGFFSPAEHKLKLSDDVIEDDFTSTPDSCIWDLSPMRLGAQGRRGNQRNRRMIPTLRIFPTAPEKENTRNDVTHF